MMDFNNNHLDFRLTRNKQPKKEFIKELAFNTVGWASITCAIYFIIFTAAGA